VCVIGIGGVGSWAAEAVARSGVGYITLIDLDHVAESNINRQIQADDATLGQAKVLSMKDRILRINPDCEVACIEEFIDADNIAVLLPACDAVIDAIDQARAKAALAAHCKRNKILLVTTGGAGGRVDPTRIRIDDLSRTTQDALASKVRARLRSEHGFTRDPKKKFGIECVYSPEQMRRPADKSCDADGAVKDSYGLNCAGYGSSVAVTAAFGMAAAAHVLTLLAKRPPRAGILPA
jgi:tRNA threonylcarbamoyladenosine dehydratase